jgi:hypothetical protein
VISDSVNVRWCFGALNEMDLCSTGSASLFRRLLTKQLEKRSRGEGRCERICVRISSGRAPRVGSGAGWSGAGVLMLRLWT